MDLASIEPNMFQHDNIECRKLGEDFTSVSLNLPLIDPLTSSIKASPNQPHPKKKKKTQNPSYCIDYMGPEEAPCE